MSKGGWSTIAVCVGSLRQAQGTGAGVSKSAKVASIRPQAAYSTSGTGGDEHIRRKYCVGLAYFLPFARLREQAQPYRHRMDARGGR
jgi:hypothetical protein